MQEKGDVPKDWTSNIWITAKTRMEASKRYQMYDTFSHIALTWYSVCLLALSVFNEQLEDAAFGGYLHEMQIVLAICVLAATGVTWGLGFGRTAIRHEACYHELETILASKQGSEEKIEAYDLVKKKYPNHSTIDYHAVLFQRIALRGEHLSNDRGPISFGFGVSAAYLTLVVLGWVFRVIILSLPLMFGCVMYLAQLAN